MHHVYIGKAIVNSPREYWASERIDIGGEGDGWSELEDGSREFRLDIRLGENRRSQRNGPADCEEYKPSIPPQLVTLTVARLDCEGSPNYGVTWLPYESAGGGGPAPQWFTLVVNVFPGCKLNRLGVVWTAETRLRVGIGA